jgi:hypothetical protein
VLKGDEEAEDLNYELVLQDWTPNKIDIKINFTNPEMISTGHSSDGMSIKVKEPGLFRSTVSGEKLPEQTSTQTAEVPK